MDSRTHYKNMLLALLLILAGLAGAIAPQTAAAEDYGIQIGYEWITSENYTNISASGGFEAVKSGTVTFDPATNTLTLNNATIEGDIYSMNKSKSYTIVLQGNNTIKKSHTTPINFSSSLRITGGGLLKIEPNNRAIFVGVDLTIDGCYIETSRYIEVRGRLEIINSQVVVANNWSKDFAYKVSGGITLSNSTITQPEGGQVKQIKTLDGIIYTGSMSLGRLLHQSLSLPVLLAPIKSSLPSSRKSWMWMRIETRYRSPSAATYPITLINSISRIGYRLRETAATMRPSKR